MPASLSSRNGRKTFENETGEYLRQP